MRVFENVFVVIHALESNEFYLPKMDGSLLTVSDAAFLKYLSRIVDRQKFENMC